MGITKDIFQQFGARIEHGIDPARETAAHGREEQAVSHVSINRDFFVSR